MRPAAALGASAGGGNIRRVRRRRHQACPAAEASSALGGGDTGDVRLFMRPPPRAKEREERAVPRRIPDERAAPRPHPVALKEKEGKCNCRIVSVVSILTDFAFTSGKQTLKVEVQYRSG